MAFLSLIWLLAYAFPSLVLAREPVPEPIDRARAIIEANRLLEEEIKLAARPHVYIVLDLAEQVIVIKSRGIELHRLPILDSRQAGEGSLKGVFRLRARPSVSRPKAASADHASVPAIELQAMPDRYDLVFDPGLIISVGQSARERPWPWMKSLVQEWWSRCGKMLGIKVDSRDTPTVRIHLTMTQEAAQSLAWTMTDGMPLMVGRAVLP